MKAIRIMLPAVAAIAFIGSAMAVPPGQKVEYAGGALGKVTFDGKAHADKGLKCDACHPKTFPMKKGTEKITMAAINKGESCGICHNGTKAPKASDPKACTTCHKK